ncbi:MAG TPA: MEKHLA domain-containing protein [Verrucomicrobiae bacterium]|nr:MEKHLA domain-containing protein [Verrucomicrobiae bacterium]
MNPSNPWESTTVIEHSVRLAENYRRWTGRELLPGGDLQNPREFAARLSAAPFVIVSHGNEADPVLNYGNRVALDLWEMSWEQLTATPSRFTAEAPNREERARLLAQVTQHGFIDNYAGIRISRTGRRFRISRATVWNILDAASVYRGQAATFAAWEFL